MNMWAQPGPRLLPQQNRQARAGAAGVAGVAVEGARGSPGSRSSSHRVRGIRESTHEARLKTVGNHVCSCNYCTYTELLTKMSHSPLSCMPETAAKDTLM